jgi:hypothetical protein
MAKYLSDTHPEAERVRIEITRRLPSARKFQMLNEMIMTGWAFSLESVRKRFPDAGPVELHRRLATMLLGPELALKVYGPEPDPPTIG